MIDDVPEIEEVCEDGTYHDDHKIDESLTKWICRTNTCLSGPQINVRLNIRISKSSLKWNTKKLLLNKHYILNLKALNK